MQTQRHKSVINGGENRILLIVRRVSAVAKRQYIHKHFNYIFTINVQYITHTTYTMIYYVYNYIK